MRLKIGTPSVLTLLGLLGRTFAAPLNSSLTFHSGSNHTLCTPENIIVRTEWSNLNNTERRDFIDSVKCLMNTPSSFPPGVAPGAMSRYDDFVATHINRTFHIHIDGAFLSFHRYFLYLFEKALRDECGYGGYLPYMDWPLYAKNLSASSIFDGSPTSLGGNGSPNASNPNISNGNYTPPAGQGGGCVYTGPFANTTCSFRNFPPLGSISSLPADALDYNPHCMRRNLNSVILANSNNNFDITRLVNEPNITAFQHRIDSIFWPGGLDTADYGIHAGGHGAVGGEMTDFFASPSDPVFWLHHTMVDRVWTAWQAGDPENRQHALNGTDLLFNNPKGVTVTLDYQQDFGYLSGPKRVGVLMSTMKGPFCYQYDDL